MQDSYFANVATGQVDAEKNVINGVSVITVGEAKGHGFSIDGKTLLSVKAVADSHKNGVKVKMNHDSGVNSAVGSLKNFRIDGNQLRADLHLLKSSSMAATVLEMAQTMPEEFGLSLTFTGQPESINGVKNARCTELYSVDLVDRPAANPAGLLSEKLKNQNMKAHIDSLRSIYKLDAALTDEQVLAAVEEKAKALSTAPPANVVTLSAADVTKIVTDAVKPLNEQITQLSATATAAKATAEQAERDNLVAEASRDGKVIPLSVDEIKETPIKLLRSMISALPKTVTLNKREPVKVLKLEERSTLAQTAHSRACDTLNQLFHSTN